ncbi:uncharacterized protein LOC144711229 [Wolffia australiana]
MGPKISARKRKKTRYLSLRRRLAAAYPPPADSHVLPSDGGAASPPPEDSYVLPSDGGAASPPPADSHVHSAEEEGDGGGGAAAASPRPYDPNDEQLSRYFPADDGGGAVSLLSLLNSPGGAADSCSSSSSAYFGGAAARSTASRHLSLKLDYDGVLSAWPNLSPFYVDADDACQVVPDLHLTALGSPVFVDVPTSESATWAVPDKEREARVMRYREKRRRRLYNKRIRYEVRKVNAEKRPRIKGRFVKRDED